MKKNAIDHQNNEKKNKRKKSQCFSKKNISCLCPKNFKKKCVNHENTESHGSMSMLSVISVFMQSHPICKLLFEKKQ